MVQQILSNLQKYIHDDINRDVTVLIESPRFERSAPPSVIS